MFSSLNDKGSACFRAVTAQIKQCFLNKQLS